jgi:mannitol-1-phosphate 5-dehydrogenase
MLYEQGWRVTFVDKNPELVTALRERGGYAARLLGPRTRTIAVEGCGYLHTSETDAIAGAIADCDVVCTAVFDQNLPDVARLLLPALSARRATGREEPLHIICCENMMDSSTTLKRHVYELADDGMRVWLDAHAAFPNSMISRIVPQPAPGTTDLVAEDYNEWTVDAAAMRCDLDLPVLQPVDDQAAYLERKLFIHNGGHAVCGYMGFHLGHRYVHEALADARVVKVVGHALDELGAVVLHKHPFFGAEEIERYKAALAVRGAVVEMRDEILRVVRDPIRKLSSRERLVAPALYAARNGLSYQWLVWAIAAALHYADPSDAQSLELRDRLESDGCRASIEDVCDIESGTALSESIVDAYARFPEFLNSLGGGGA